VAMLPDETEGRHGDYTATADQRTSHDQATSTTNYSDGGRYGLAQADQLRAAAVKLAEHRSKAFPLRGNVPTFGDPLWSGLPQRGIEPFSVQVSQLGSGKSLSRWGGLPTRTKRRTEWLCELIGADL
jgi:hypothetical protein